MMGGHSAGNGRFFLCRIGRRIRYNSRSRPERTRISCHAALEKAAYAPFRKEGRMKCSNAAKSNRKSGVA
jgi:hypothetical protein